MITFRYEISREAGDVLVTGETQHLFLNKDGRPMKVPEKYRPLFGLK